MKSCKIFKKQVISKMLWKLSRSSWSLGQWHGYNGQGLWKYMRLNQSFRPKIFHLKLKQQYCKAEIKLMWYNWKFMFFFLLLLLFPLKVSWCFRSSLFSFLYFSSSVLRAVKETVSWYDLFWFYGASCLLGYNCLTQVISSSETISESLSV